MDFHPDHSNVIGGQITVCKTAPDHMANRIVKEHAAMKEAYAQPLRMYMVQVTRCRKQEWEFSICSKKQSEKMTF